MNATAVAKSRALNWLEAITLSAIFKMPPVSAVAVLMFIGAHGIADRHRAAVVVALVSPLYTLTMSLLGPIFPKSFEYTYEPLFFDATLSFSEKLSHWRTQPNTSLQPAAAMIALLLLTVLVVIGA
jgi:hypothetical protein